MLIKLVVLLVAVLLGLLALRARLMRRFPRMKATPLDRAFARAGQEVGNTVLAVVVVAAAFLVLLHVLDRF
ncbi:MAG TPA: hypothetical protein VIL65_00245 [Beijerinckiaceae bacterium]|jgi:predicted PurR-regulated permease PerM